MASMASIPPRRPPPSLRAEPGTVTPAAVGISNRKFGAVIDLRKMVSGTN
jgi:hypothetical protein